MFIVGSMTTFAGDTNKVQGVSPAAVEQMHVINQLIGLGDARKDPILLLAAAKLQKSLSDNAVATSTESHASKDVLKRKGRQYNYSNGYYTHTTYRQEAVIR